jgi:hypothetical protein
MTFPPDLPWLIEYRLDFAVLTAMPRKPVEFIGSSGATNAAQVCPRIPYGARAWRVPGGPWRPLSEMPKDWLPFVNRERGTEMDPRPKLKTDH